MSSANEATEMWKEVREHEKKVHEERKGKNLAILRASPTRIDILVKNGGDVLLIRDRHYPSVDFYPSTNKWKVGNRMMMGNAEALLDWLGRNRRP